MIQKKSGRARGMTVRLIMILGAAIAGLVSSTIVAAPASAATTYVYVSLPTWLGNCPGGGSVKWLSISSWSASTSATASDSGDDLVYLRVGLNENVTLTGAGRCYAWWGQYNSPAVSVVVRPTRYQQTWWIGPNGVRSN